MKNINRTKRTALNAVANLTSLTISSLASLIVTRAVLKYIGSDYNGLNATVSQVLSLLTVFEGSFTLASLVALYKPYETSDYEQISKIVSTTSNAFYRIGITMFLIGTLFCFGYAFFIKTSLSYFTVVIVMLLSIFATTFNTTFISKYRLLFQVSQSEYIVSFIISACNVAAHICAVFIVKYTRDIILVRLNYTVFTVLSSLIISVLARKLYRNIRYNMPPDFSLIRGTKDVIVSTITGLIYQSSAVFFISTFVGTIFTSVYSVYSSVTSMIQNVVYAFLNSPKNALGQVIAVGDSKRLETVFDEFEFITIFLVTLLFSTTYAFIIPFVKVYTLGISDVDYIQPEIALLLIANLVFQFVHIPSGLLIELSGYFKVKKKIQLIALGVIVPATIVGALLWKLYGILLANTATSIVLALFEISYARRNILHKSPKTLILMFIPNIVCFVLISFVENQVAASLITDLVSFFAITGICFVINGILLCGINYFLFPKYMKAVICRFGSLLKKVNS